MICLQRIPCRSSSLNIFEDGVTKRQLTLLMCTEWSLIASNFILSNVSFAFKLSSLNKLSFFCRRDCRYKSISDRRDKYLFQARALNKRQFSFGAKLLTRRSKHISLSISKLGINFCVWVLVFCNIFAIFYSFRMIFYKTSLLNERLKYFFKWRKTKQRLFNSRNLAFVVPCAE